MWSPASAGAARRAPPPRSCPQARSRGHDPQLGAGGQAEAGGRITATDCDGQAPVGVFVDQQLTLGRLGEGAYIRGGFAPPIPQLEHDGMAEAQLRARQVLMADVEGDV